MTSEVANEIWSLTPRFWRCKEILKLESTKLGNFRDADKVNLESINWDYIWRLCASEVYIKCDLYWDVYQLQTLKEYRS